MKLRADLAGDIIDAIVAFEDDALGGFSVDEVIVSDDRGGTGAWRVTIATSNQHGISSTLEFVGGVDYAGAVWIEAE